MRDPNIFQPNKPTTGLLGSPGFKSKTESHRGVAESLTPRTANPALLGDPGVAEISKKDVKKPKSQIQRSYTMRSQRDLKRISEEISELL
jgi:hypothetical protein